MSLVKAMATVAGLTMLSRVVGMIRDILVAAFLGAGVVADAFFVALKLPNFFRRITAEGAFSVSFVPLYTQIMERDGQEKAGRFAGQALSVMFVVLSVFVFLMIAGMPWVISGIAAGFERGGETYNLAIELSRITFPYLLFMSMTALLGGVMNAHSRFAPFAFAPVLFNICLITALLVGTPLLENSGWAMSFGVLGAGIVQLVWLWVCVKRSGVSIPILRPHLSPEVKRVFALMGPGVIGAGVMHINLFADVIIASFLESGSISFLYYADRLYQLPLGVIGIAVGTALLPMLSRAVAAEKHEEANGLYNRALEYCLILGMPAAVALASIPVPIITVLFERGAFDSADTLATAGVLMGYAIGLPAYMGIKVFSTAFWARQDTKTPVKIAVFVTALNICLSLMLIEPFGVAGIALSTGLVAWVQFFLNMWILRGEKIAALDARFKRVFPRIVLSCCIMGAVLYSSHSYFLEQFFDDEFIYKVLALLALVLEGIIIYGLAAALSGVVNIQEFKRFFSKR